MESLKHNLALRIVKISNAVMMTIPFFACWYLYYAHHVVSPYYAKGNYLIVFLFFTLYIIYGKLYDAFLIPLLRISEIFYSQMLASMLADGIMYIITWLLTKHLPNILPLLAAIAVQGVLSAVWSILAHRWYFRTYPPKKSAIIYDEREGLGELISAYGLDKKYDVRETLHIEDCIDDLAMLDRTETVFLSGVHSRQRNVILKYCVLMGIDVYVIPRIGDVIMSGARAMHMFHLPVLRVGRYNPQPEYLFIKRTFDIIASAIALVVLSPIFLVTAFAIKITDGGPVFYKQARLTKDGRRFNMIKFRSMRVDAEKDGVARLSTGDNDDRVTSVGRFIRKVRIDELPQLWLILVGVLSICGPRPERPEIAEKYCEQMPEFSLRLQAKAGLTGYAQVYGKYNTTPYDKLQMDLMYIANPSFVEDLKIMFATIKILFMQESTEGIGEGAIITNSNKVIKKISKSKKSDKASIAWPRV